uniref:Uncharacterized protein n=1 Tax=Anguilla anguilla TaxID=7936 RepID=A0A0E9XST0_ANGAN
MRIIFKHHLGYTKQYHQQVSKKLQRGQGHGDRTELSETTEFRYWDPLFYTETTGQTFN